MTTFYAFPSIEQFRNVIRNVRDHVRYAGRDANDDPIFNTNPLPKIEYHGTVKLHGTNAAIVATAAGMHFQSRSNIITPEQDNAGFATWGEQNRQRLWKLFTDSFGEIECSNCTVKLYGEWCGGNIQKGVAINGLPKMFVLFGIRIDDEWYKLDASFRIEDLNDIGFYSIDQFPSKTVTIDFEHPQLIQNILGELTLEVEEKCPVGAYFGKEGIGEGIVWKPVDAAFNYSKFWFKVKGEKHSVSKVKTLAAVDVEAVQNLKDFIDNTVTEARLEQGLSVLQESGKPFDMTSMGDFIRWVYNDVVKEESDTAEASGIDIKKLGGAVANVARPWYIKKLKL